MKSFLPQLLDPLQPSESASGFSSDYVIGDASALRRAEARHPVEQTKGDERQEMKSLKANLPWLLDRLQPSESAVIGGMALLVGLTSGMAVWLFKRLIDIAHFVAFDWLGALFASLGSWTIILLPV